MLKDKAVTWIFKSPARTRTALKVYTIYYQHVRKETTKSTTNTKPNTEPKVQITNLK